MAADASIPLGTTESYPLPGVTTLIRIEPHVWGRDPQGTLVQGCFRAGGIYLPSGTPEGTAGITPPESKINKAITVFTLASLVAGTIATVSSLGGGQ
jgi:hypothetical protein